MENVFGGFRNIKSSLWERIHEWNKRFKEGRASVVDKERSGRPSTAKKMRKTSKKFGN